MIANLCSLASPRFGDDSMLASKWMPIILPDRCTGCGLCVLACGPQCLELVGGVAVLAHPDHCGSEEHCIAVCRDDAIHMRWIPTEGNWGGGKWRIENEI